MKLNRLHLRGSYKISKDAMTVAIVAIFAITSVAYTVAGHADACPPVSGPTSEPTSGGTDLKARAVSEPTSGPTSGPACQPTSGPVSQTIVSGTGVVNGVPAAPANGTTMYPVLIVTNTGNTAFTSQVQVSLNIYNSRGGVSSTKSQFFTVAVQPGQASRVALTPYRVLYGTPTAATGSYIVNSNGPRFNSSTSFRLPSTRPIQTD